MGCKHARCATRFCRYLKDADEARHEATLKRRIAEAEAAPSPTRAGRKANPGQGSPGSGINVPPAHAANTTRAKRAKQVSLADRDPAPLQGGWQRDNAGRASGSGGNPRHAILSPRLRRMAANPQSNIRRIRRISRECRAN